MDTPTREGSAHADNASRPTGFADMQFAGTTARIWLRLLFILLVLPPGGAAAALWLAHGWSENAAEKLLIAAAGCAVWFGGLAILLIRHIRQRRG